MLLQQNHNDGGQRRCDLPRQYKWIKCMKLLDLPTELILHILENLEDSQSLRRIASLSRLLRDIALRVYFLIHHIDPSFKEIAIRCTSYSNDPIPGLLLHPSITGASLNRLFCHFSDLYDLPYSMISEVHAVNRLVAKLASIQKVTLGLRIVISSSHNTLHRWEIAIVELLEALLQKSHGEIYIYHAIPSFSWIYDHDRMHSNITPTRPPLPLQIFKLLVRKKNLTSSMHIILRLRTLIPLYAQLHSRKLDMSSITELHLNDIFNRNLEWPAYLPSMHFPNLSLLSLNECNFWYSDFIHFLVQNSTITSLSLRASNLHEPYAAFSFPKKFLPRLNALACAPQLLGHLDRRKTLSPSTICLSSGLPSALRTHIVSIADALPLLSHHSGKITLVLEIFSERLHDQWFHTVSNLPAAARARRVEASLDCVTKLEISTGRCYHFSSVVLKYISTWLGLFPALEHVSFIEGSIDEGTTYETKGAFAHLIGRECPRLKAVEIDGDVFKISQRVFFLT